MLCLTLPVIQRNLRMVEINKYYYYYYYMGALLQIFRLFWRPKISPLKSIHLKKILAKFSYPKKSQNQKFQTQKIPRQEPMHLWNPSLPKITCLINSFAVILEKEVKSLVCYINLLHLCRSFNSSCVISCYFNLSFVNISRPCPLLKKIAL